MSVLYHPFKRNVIVDALSRLTTGSVAYFLDDKKELVKEVHRLSRLGVWLEDSPYRGSNFIITLNYP